MNISNSFGYGSFSFNYGNLAKNKADFANTANNVASPEADKFNMPSSVGQVENKEDLIAEFNKLIEENTSKKQKIADVTVSNSLPSVSISNTRNFHTELDDDCEKLVGAILDNRNGITISVFKPKNFDEENPMYKVKTWDANGNMEEKYIKVSEVDPKNAGYDEMFAYTSYLSDSGKYPDAQLRFMTALGIEEVVRDYNGIPRDDLYNAKTNWVNIVKKAMDMQFDCGNKEGFLKFKGFWDYLNNSDSEVASKSIFA